MPRSPSLWWIRGCALSALWLCGSSAAGAAESKADEPTFDVQAYDIDGNTLLTTAELETAVYNHMGPEVPRSGVEAARKSLEDAYHAKGFDSVVVEAPAQTVADHVVRLHVVETQVGRLRVTGARYYALSNIRNGVTSLQENTVPNFQAAQADLAELNRTPGRQITPLVKPGRIPGTVDVDLKVTDKRPYHASLELSNDHSPDTSPLRLTASLGYDNLWQAGHSISLSYAVAPEDRGESEVFAASYLAPIPRSHWNLLLYGYNSNSNVATLGDVSVLGKGYTIGLRAIGQLPPLGPVSESLAFGTDFKHVYQLIAAGKTAPSEAAVDYWPLTITYSLQYESKGATTHLSLGVTTGVRTNAGDEAQFQINRSYAHGNFIHVNFEAEHSRPLPHGFGLDLRLSAQLANQSLLSGEQFSAGGATSVRGYLQSATVGDQGVAGSIELKSPPLPVSRRHWFEDWRTFIYSDAADTWLVNPLADQTREVSIYSAGFGARMLLLDRIIGSVVVGMPLTTTRSTSAYTPYAYFNLKANY